MINSSFAWLLATFVLAPMQAEIGDKLKAAKASPAVISEMQSCLATAKPVLLARAGNDWWWGIATVTGVATGYSDPKALLVAAVPACKPAVDAARPLLQRAEG